MVEQWCCFSTRERTKSCRVRGIARMKKGRVAHLRNGKFTFAAARRPFLPASCVRWCGHHRCRRRCRCVNVYARQSEQIMRGSVDVDF